MEEAQRYRVLAFFLTHILAESCFQIIRETSQNTYYQIKKNNWSQAPNIFVCCDFLVMTHPVLWEYTMKWR